MKHPEVFSTVYALAPCCLAMEADLTEANPSWSKVVRLTSKEQLKPKPESLDDFYTIVFLALSAALSPNADRGPFFVDFPFKEREGGCVEAGPVSAASTKVPCLARNGTAYNNWVARLPLYMVEGKTENLLKLRGLFIDYGEKEEFPTLSKAVVCSHKRYPSKTFPMFSRSMQVGHTATRSANASKPDCCNSFQRNWTSHKTD